jgi:hypothetical protein
MHAKFTLSLTLLYRFIMLNARHIHLNYFILLNFVIIIIIIIIIVYLFLTEIGLTPGGRSTVHIYTQTIHSIQRMEHA